jgi:hypothetical protein
MSKHDPLVANLHFLISEHLGRLQRRLETEVQEWAEKLSSELPPEYGKRLLKRAGIEPKKEERLGDQDTA